MKDDRRTLYTLRVIREVFLALLEEKPLNKISIQELCTLADISRTTFYAHYKDIYDLMDKTVHNWLDSIGLEQLLNINYPGASKLEFSMTNYFTVLDENANLGRLLLTSQYIQRYYEDFLSKIKDSVIQNWLDHEEELSNADAEYRFQFLQSGIIGTIILWLSKGDQRESAETFAKINSKLRLVDYLEASK